MREFLAGDFASLAAKCRRVMATAYATSKRESAAIFTVNSRRVLVTAYAPNRGKPHDRGTWMISPFREGVAQEQWYLPTINDAMERLLLSCGIPYDMSSPETYCGVTTPHHLAAYPNRYANLIALTQDAMHVQAVELIGDDCRCVLLDEQRQPFKWVPLDYPIHLRVKGAA